MSKKTKVGWTRSSFNPWTGCEQVGPGCLNCYAKALRDRFDGGRSVLWLGERKLSSDKYWDEPRKWNAKAQKTGEFWPVFCASMADVFDNVVPDEWRARLWALIRDTPALTWQIVTKRIGNAAKMLPADWGDGYPNVWIIATVCNQEEFDRDAPKLERTPAKVRGLSIEPMLGPIDVGQWLGNYDCHMCQNRFYSDNILTASLDSDAIKFATYDTEDCVEGAERVKCPYCGQTDGCGEVGQINEEDRPEPLDWIICGGESGPQARTIHPDWVRSLRDQCAAARVPFFFKQWGKFTPDPDGNILIKPHGTKVAYSKVVRAASYARPGDAVMARSNKDTLALLDGAWHDAYPLATYKTGEKHD